MYVFNMHHIESKNRQSAQWTICTHTHRCRLHVATNGQMHVAAHDYILLYAYEFLRDVILVVFVINSLQDFHS